MLTFSVSILLLLQLTKTCNAWTYPGVISLARFRNKAKLEDVSKSLKAPKVEVGELVGSGAHGTVHICSLEGKQWIGKRAWTKEDIRETTNAATGREKLLAKREAKRCEQYMRVEEHCFQKLGMNSQLPFYKGTYLDKKYRPWMLFELVESSLVADQTSAEDEAIAPTLADLMERDRTSNNKYDHHLRSLENALGIVGRGDSSLGETLDVFFDSLLSVLTYTNSKQIIHRDVKPENLLVAKNSVRLIDFGSAVDLDLKPRRAPIRRVIKRLPGVYNREIAAVSPTYAPPELFVDHEMQPMTFDIFSAAFIYCQLLFNYLDESSGEGFYEKLASCNWNLEVWMVDELASNGRSDGLKQALRVLSERRGLFRLLSDMLKGNPSRRIRSDQAFDRFRDILVGNTVRDDGLVFEGALKAAGLVSAKFNSPQHKPLHFTCPFFREDPLGLVLSPASDTDVLGYMDLQSKTKWRDATKDASPDQMFVTEVEEGGQADEFGSFEIGDRFQGVGELPFGFAETDESAELPPSEYLTLHFDRKKSAREKRNYVETVDYGVWATQGQRDYQEDSFIFHECLSPLSDQSILLAGIMDGHGGDAASKMVSTMLPETFSAYMFGDKQRRVPVSVALEKAWETVCESYRESYSWQGDSIEEYDPAKEMLIRYGDEEEDAVAGTTSSILALDESNGEINILNCGDSRSLVIDSNGLVLFETSDHSPQFEIDRLRAGIEQGMDYSLPECDESGWYLPVGDYAYALSRSLEGHYATSKGIISCPDMTALQGKPGMTIVVASDGLFEGMDSNEMANHVVSSRLGGKSAGDLAKTLCAMALEQGSSDNISVVIMYL